MEGSRPQWGTRVGFIFAAVGSAVGLGNIWRFPGVAYENGGGAFLIPYLFAILTAGIPILILEFTLGQKYRGSAPLVFARLGRKYEWLGWVQVAISFVICTYYAVIVAWASVFAYLSFGQKWGDDPNSYFFGEFLQLGEVGEVGSIVPHVFFPLAIIWIVALTILYKGVRKGIEISNKIFIPALIFLFLIIVIRSVTLEGAMDGLNALFTPNWGELTNPSIWVAAYSQIFFSLSVAFAIMVTYASYLPKKTDITNNAFITAFANSGVELLAGIGVFAALGFMANQTNVPIDEVVSKGIGLAFVVFPQIINEFPAFNGLLGSAFFICLVLAGLTSLISIIETFVAAICDKFHVSRNKSVLFGGGLAACISLIYSTQGGLYFLDVVDYFINNFGIVISGLLELAIVIWILNKTKELKMHANSMSDIQLRSWWDICLKFITPLILGYMTIQIFITNFTSNYEGYPTSFLVKFGWLVLLIAIVLSVVLSQLKWKDTKIENYDFEKEVG